MLRTLRIGLVVFGLLVVAVQNAAADLYISQVGDGTAPVAITDAGALFVRHFSTAGADLGTIALPTAVSGAIQPITNRYNSTTEGVINASTNGQYLLFGGYAATPGTATPDTAAVSRVIERVKISDGTLDQMVFTDTTFAGSSFRSVASTNGTDIWMGGNASSAANGGARYTTFGTTTSVQLASTNGRAVGIYNDAGGTPQLYLGTMSGTASGVNTVGTGLPTSGTQTLTLLNGMAVDQPGSSTISFWFADAATLYKADSRLVSAGGGIQKWTFDTPSSTWQLKYTLDAGTGGVPASAQGVTGVVNAGVTTLYSTNFGDQLVSIVDAGAGSAATLLASAGANKHWRGVAFVNSAPPGVSGDYNGNGVVDGADYVLWRNGGALQNDPNPGNPTAQYNFWRSRFGAITGSGSGLGSSAAVPEPASVLLLLIGVVAFSGRRRQA